MRLPARTVLAGAIGVANVLVWLPCLAAPAPSRYLLLDSRIVEATDGVKLTVGKVVKHPANPLFGEEYPWEHRFDNLYPNVYRDPEDGITRCWYNHFITYTPSIKAKWKLEKPYPPGTPKHLMAVAYAVSTDGLKWHKPLMNIELFKGKRSNMVLVGPHGAGVFKDLHEKDGARRYKMFFRQAKNEPSVAFSPDGLHWGKPLSCREIQARADTHNNAIWVPELERYAGITRLFDGQRIVGRTESRDFVHWTKAVEILRGTRKLQTYAMPVFRYEGVYLGLLTIFRTVEDRVHCELAWSPDTVRWERIEPGTPLIPDGETKGAYDWGCVYAAARPVVLENEIRLYYGASNDTHYGRRKGFLALATLRPGRFAGYEPVEPGAAGTVLTKPLVVTGKQLRVNAGAEGGAIRVEVISAEGKVLRESRPITNDGCDTAVAWKGGGDLGPLVGRVLRLRFKMDGGKLYALRFSD